jgi:hypothetical protein
MMRIRGELLIFLKVLRAATSSPVNWITCAIAIAIFVIATTPPPLDYAGMKAEAGFIAFGALLLPFFVLYLTARLIIAIFGRRRQAIFFASALLALLTPIVIGVVATVRYDRYGNVSAIHALVAKLYDSKLKNGTSLDVRAAKLIDLGEACYPSVSGYECWVVVTSPVEDSDVAQDIGDWHDIKSSTLLRLLPAYVQYGEVAVQRIHDRIYSVLSHDYQGR